MGDELHLVATSQEGMTEGEEKPAALAEEEASSAKLEEETADRLRWRTPWREEVGAESSGRREGEIEW
jgi:hypothetical protein